MASFSERVIGAAKLDVRIYEEVEADTGALGQAMSVVVLQSIAAGIGAIGYLIYFAGRSSTQCPVCRRDVYGLVKPAEGQTTLADRHEAQRAERAQRHRGF